MLFLLLLGLISSKLGFWSTSKIQYFLACQYPGRNWGWWWHGLLHAVPSKLGNALKLFINVINHECQVVSGGFRSFT